MEMFSVEKKEGKELYNMLPFGVKMSKTKIVCSYQADKCEKTVSKR